MYYCKCFYLCANFTPLFVCEGVNIGGAGSYVYDTPVTDGPADVPTETEPKPAEKKASAPPKGPVKGRQDKEEERNGCLDNLWISLSFVQDSSFCLKPKYVLVFASISGCSL